MSYRLLGIGAATALVLVTGVAAQNAADDRAPAPAARQFEQQRGPGQGPFGPGRGMGRGGPAGAEQRRGRGPGAGMGIGQGPGRGMRFGEGPGRGMGPRGGAMVAERLNLTDDQRTKVDTLQRAARDRATAIQSELEYARRSLHRETFADTRNASTLSELAAKVTSFEKQLFDIRLETQTAIADVLTPAQRETMRLLEGRRGGR